MLEAFHWNQKKSEEHFSLIGSFERPVVLDPAKSAPILNKSLSFFLRLNISLRESHVPTKIERDIHKALCNTIDCVPRRKVYIHDSWSTQRDDSIHNQKRPSNIAPLKFSTQTSP